MSIVSDRTRYRLRRLYRTALVNVMDAIRWTGLVGHAHWCCMSRHSLCVKDGGCSGSCNCNARRAQWRDEPEVGLTLPRTDATVASDMCPRCKGDNAEPFALCANCATT